MLEINTRPEAYAAIEVKINGKVYRARRITRPVLLEIDEQAQKAKEGEVDAAYKQLEIIFGKKKEFDDLDLREVQKIITFVTEEIFKADLPKDLEAESKKAKEPGEKESA